MNPLFLKIFIGFLFILFIALLVIMFELIEREERKAKEKIVLYPYKKLEKVKLSGKKYPINPHFHSKGESPVC